MPETVLQTVARGLVELVFPQTCHCCGNTDITDSQSPFCHQCQTKLQQLQGPQCPRCAAHYPTFHPQATNCPHCQNEEYAFTHALSWGNYESILRDIVIQLKNQSNESLAHHIGALFASQFLERYLSLSIDAVVPVPLHWTRRLWRGYNQAETLAQAIAQQLGKLTLSHSLWRRLQTPHQSQVTPHQRRKNLKQAMAARLPKTFLGKTLLLVDDVMTTGATADACARVLLSAGAACVHVAVLARAAGTSPTIVTT